VCIGGEGKHFSITNEHDFNAKKRGAKYKSECGIVLSLPLLSRQF